MAGILDPVNELAGSAHRDREFFCNVVHPACTASVDDLHWFEPGEREMVAGLEPPIKSKSSLNRPYRGEFARPAGDNKP